MTDHIDTAQERGKLEGLRGKVLTLCESCGDEHSCHDASDMRMLPGGQGVICECCDDAAGFTDFLLPAPDLLGLTHRLLDALDAERARAEKAEAALQRVVDAAWNEAVGACAWSFDDDTTVQQARVAILALKRPEASHE